MAVTRGAIRALQNPAYRPAGARFFVKFKSFGQGLAHREGDPEIQIPSLGEFGGALIRLIVDPRLSSSPLDRASRLMGGGERDARDVPRGARSHR